LETKTFAELGLSSKVQAAINAAGYTTPTPIQAAAIPIAVTGRDVLGIAQTGTGKTASFVLPMITRLETGRARARMPRSLILAPTRELAAQVAQSFEKYGINNKLNLALLIGGVSMDDQVKKLDRGVDVLIATPGRLLDHFQRGRIMLMGVEILVIDEADRMLDMGFIPDIEKICKLLPPRRQTLFFSATMPPEITRLVSQFLKDPERIEVAPPATAAKTITQQFVYCPNGEDWAKRETLRELIRRSTVRNAIIFCNRKVEVAILHKSLVKHGFSAGALHGDMDQKARMETLDKFRAGELKLLAASDVAARGLDIPDVSHIFNFDLPWQPDDYVHRIGRTGRAGKEGVSTSLVTTDELKSLKDIEKMLGEPVAWIGEAPSDEDFASAGKKRRGRGGRVGPQRGRGGRSSGAPAQARGDDKPRQGERRGGGGQRGGERREPRPEARPESRPEARPEQRAEQREPAREQRPEHREQPRHEQREQQRAARPQNPQPAAHAPNGGQRQQPRNGHADAKPAAQPRGERQQRPERSRERQPEGGRSGFADNVPAFLRNPVKRPAKVAGE
jgi:superfamily II DNA/RNA helicase